MYEVSSLVNRPSNDGPEVVVPAGEEVPLRSRRAMPDRGFCETKARPHVALDVIDPALRLSLGLGLVRTVQPHLESHPQGHIQHPQVPFHLAIPARPSLTALAWS